MRRKVVRLSLVEIDTILDLAKSPPQASEVVPASESPVSHRMVPELRESIVSALERARNGELLDGPAYDVPLALAEADELSRWCRDAAPPVGGYNTDALVAAAAKIDATP